MRCGNCWSLRRWCCDVHARHGAVFGGRVQLVLGIPLLLLVLVLVLFMFLSLSPYFPLAVFPVWRKVCRVYTFRRRRLLTMRPRLLFPYHRMRCRWLGVDGQDSAVEGGGRDGGIVNGRVGGRGDGVIELGRLHFHRGVGEGVSLGGFRGAGGIKRWCCDRRASSAR